MYKNLLAEIAKTGLNKSDFAKLLNISVRDFLQKLAGKQDFKLDECLKIKSALPNNKLGIEYLFSIN